jgi:hypothetical protein
MNRPVIHRPEPELGLSDYHRRCLDKRIGECDEALAQAVCALYEAESWVPSDLSLHALSGLLQAAHSLTEVAHHISGASRSDSELNAGRISR